MTEQAPTLCVHHHPCADGFTAAWAVWKRFGDSVKFHPGVHGQPPPDVTGEHVVIVDFSYPKDVLFEMCKTAASILVLPLIPLEPDMITLKVAEERFSIDQQIGRAHV